MNLPNWLRRKPAMSPNLKLIYTAKDGTRYYEFKEVGLIPAIRAISGERAARFAEMKMTEATLKMIVEDLKKNCKLNNWGRVFQVVDEMNLRLNLYTEENALLELACQYVIIEGEDVENPSPALNERKVTAWREDGAARSFFTMWAYRLIQDYSHLQPSDLVAYLEATQNVQRRLDQLLSRV